MKPQAARHSASRDTAPGGARDRYPAILAYGFRPFFLLAGIYAAIAIPFWIAIMQGAALPRMPLPAQAWHAHEMLYGFVAAAVAGFMLTAVPGWTGHRGYSGTPLAALVLLWLAGRLVTTLPLGLPLWGIAAIDLAFLPALALTLLPTLIRSGNRRNLVFIGLLALLFASNLQFYRGGASTTASLLLGLNAMLFMITLLGSRILPAFTSAALEERGLEVGIPRHQPLDKAALAAIGCVLVVDIVFPDSRFAAGIAALSAALLGVQLSRWHGHRTEKMPILWVLHVGYAWLPISLALKAALLFSMPVFASSWIHALTAGAMATMIIGIMSRASLGHTGRALIAPTAIAAAYVSITGAALSRVFGPLLLPAMTPQWWVLSAMLWSLAFALFVIVFAPILCRPRADGRPG